MLLYCFILTGVFKKYIITVWTLYCELSEDKDQSTLLSILMAAPGTVPDHL